MEGKVDKEKSSNRKGKKYVFPFVQFASSRTGKIEEIRWKNLEATRTNIFLIKRDRLREI